MILPILNATLSFVYTKEFFILIAALSPTILAIIAGIFNPVMSKKLRIIKKENKDQHAGIKKDISSLSLAIGENTKITKQMQEKRKAIELLENVYKNSVEFISDEKLKEFITLKSRSIIAFHNELIAVGFDNISEKQISSKITASKNEVWRIGNEILGEAFVDLFYDENHNQLTSFFERDIINILHSDINYKTEALRARTEVFLRESIVKLVEEWTSFNKNK